LLEDSIKILYCLSQGSFHRSFDKQPIEETRKTLSRFVCYDQTIFAAGGNRLEVAFMSNVGKALLLADISDSRILLEFFQFHV
jgi:hypothetical protein